MVHMGEPRDLPVWYEGKMLRRERKWERRRHEMEHCAACRQATPRSLEAPMGWLQGSYAGLMPLNVWASEPRKTWDNRIGRGICTHHPSVLWHYLACRLWARALAHSAMLLMNDETDMVWDMRVLRQWKMSEWWPWTNICAAVFLYYRSSSSIMESELCGFCRILYESASICCHRDTRKFGGTIWRSQITLISKLMGLY